MYDLLTVKKDILELGNLNMNKSYHIQILKKEGYHIVESYRIFDEIHALNVMLGTKKGKSFIILNLPKSTNYKYEEFNGQSLLKEIIHLNKDGLIEVQKSLKSDSEKSIEFMKYLQNTNFKNKLQICINNIRLKSIMLFTSIIFIIFLAISS